MAPERSTPVDKTGAPPSHDGTDSHKIEPRAASPVNPDAVQQEALRRHRQEWAVVWVFPESKRPQPDWDTVVYTEDQIPDAFPVADAERNVKQRNIGVRLGQDSGGLVVADLDGIDPAVAALALPPTGLRDGRPGRPNSHWYFRVDGSFPKATFRSPITKSSTVELLGDGQQVNIPPSLHDSGEYRAWVVDDEPATVDADELRAAAGQAAAFNEIALVWERLGQTKHRSSLPLAGGLLRAGIDPDTIKALLEIIWPSADDGEIRNAVDGTVRKHDNNEAYSGWSKLREEWGDEFKPSIDAILRWLAVEGAEDERPVVVFRPGSMDRATEEAWKALRTRNEPPFLFSQTTSPVRVELDHKGRAVITALDVYRMRYHLLREVRWLKPGKKGVLEPADAPVEFVRNVLAVPNAQLPPLTTVTVAPVLSPSGEIQLEPGYHAENMSYYWPLPGFTIPAVSASPSKADVTRAKALLLDELMGDFPFEGEAERANALALALLPFGRSVIDGPTPIHFIEAPKPGTGKSKMADLFTRLVCGPAGAASISETTDEEEWRKRLTASLLTGSPFLFIDNITQTLQSSNISTAVTKREWKDRILGKSEEVTLDIRVVWVITANNAAVNLDIARRAVRIRLNANVEHPWSRGPECFAHPDLEAWVAGHWGELVWACLTLWRAWVAAGKPRGRAVLGSFEDWAAIMSGLMDVISMPGFLANQQDFVGMATQDGSRWHELIDAWWDRYGTDAVRPKALYEQVACRVEGFEYENRKESGKTTAFGMELRRERDSIYGRVKVAVEMVNQKPVYRLEHLDGVKRTEEDWQGSGNRPVGPVPFDRGLGRSGT